MISKTSSTEQEALNFKKQYGKNKFFIVTKVGVISKYFNDKYQYGNDWMDLSDVGKFHGHGNNIYSASPTFMTVVIIFIQRLKKDLIF